MKQPIKQTLKAVIKDFIKNNQLDIKIISFDYVNTLVVETPYDICTHLVNSDVTCLQIINDTICFQLENNGSTTLYCVYTTPEATLRILNVDTTIAFEVLGTEDAYATYNNINDIIKALENATNINYTK